MVSMSASELTYEVCVFIFMKQNQCGEFNIDTKSNTWTYTKQVCIHFIWFAEVAFKLIASLVHDIDCAWYWLSKDDDWKRW